MLRRFECKGCGYDFTMVLTSVVHRCLGCDRPLVAYGYTRTRAEAIAKQWTEYDSYSRTKYYWIECPKAHTENISRRGKTQSGAAFLKDSSGARIQSNLEARPI